MIETSHAGLLVQEAHGLIPDWGGEEDHVRLWDVEGLGPLFMGPVPKKNEGGCRRIGDCCGLEWPRKMHRTLEMSLKMGLCPKIVVGDFVVGSLRVQANRNPKELVKTNARKEGLEEISEPKGNKHPCKEHAPVQKGLALQAKSAKDSGDSWSLVPLRPPPVKSRISVAPPSWRSWGAPKCGGRILDSMQLTWVLQVSYNHNWLVGSSVIVRTWWVGTPHSRGWPKQSPDFLFAAKMVQTQNVFCCLENKKPKQSKTKMVQTQKA